MVELLSDPHAWLSLLTLTALEIVLGIDNLVFVAILAEKLPAGQRAKARRMGLGLALIMRVGLLFSITWLMGLTEPLLTLMGKGFSARDLVLIGGGAFLLYKATKEVHEQLEDNEDDEKESVVSVTFTAVVSQIVVIDIVFSLDSVITAVGMAGQLPVMIAAVVLAMVVMLVAANPLSAFVNAHPTVLMLCLGFLSMVGMALIAEGMGFHIPKGYLYAAMGFSIAIEALNQVRSKRKGKVVQLNKSRDLAQME